MVRFCIGRIWSQTCEHHRPRRQKSNIPGSQHLHGPIPGLTSPYPEGTIQFVRLGSAADYAEKVYGDRDQETGWGNYFQVYPSWNAVKAYGVLWDTYQDKIRNIDIDSWKLVEIVKREALIISTIPQWAICKKPKEHRFNGKPFYIKTLPTPEGDESTEIVVYNGIPEDHWYRWSILGGLCSIESTRRMEGSIAGTKALNNNCDCWEGILHRVGRWAEWQHGVTMYSSYNRAVRLIEEHT
jgi:hypothetical protein